MERLGLWLGDRTPFTTRHSFFQKLEKAGVAGLDVISRGLKSMGLYLSRSISFQGVEYAVIEHSLTAQQISTYDPVYSKPRSQQEKRSLPVNSQRFSNF